MRGTFWTPEEAEFLREHWQEMSDEEIGERLGRSPSAVTNKRHKLGLVTTQRRHLTEEEVQYLVDHWGESTSYCIAQYLGCDEKTVLAKASRLKLGPQTGNAELLSIRNVACMLNLDDHYVKDVFVVKHGLKHVRKSVRGNKWTVRKKKRNRLCYLIKMKDLLEFLRTHPELWDATRVERYALGVEYDWLVEKRKQDANGHPKKKRRNWEQWELDYLASALRQNIPRKDIAERLGRPISAIYSQSYTINYITGRKVKCQSAKSVVPA